jgi:hypothetical protein
VDKTGTVADQLSQLFGLTANSQFRRAAFSTDSSTMEVWSGFRVTNLYSGPQEWLRAEGNALTSRGYVLGSPIPVAMNPEKAQCLLGEANSTRQPRYVEYCLLQDVELYVALDATRMEDLAEAAAIIGTGQSVRHDHYEHIQPGTGRVNPQAPSPIDTNGELSLQPMPQKQLKLVKMGESGGPAKFFADESPRCIQTDASDGEASGRKKGCWRLTGMGELETSDGTNLSFSTYVTPDGTAITISRGDFQSAKSAEAELNLRVKTASRVIERSANTDIFGEKHGRRAVLAQAEAIGPSETLSVIWTNGNHYWEVSSTSMPLLKTLEKKYRY